MHNICKIKQRVTTWKQIPNHMDLASISDNDIIYIIENKNKRQFPTNHIKIKNYLDRVL